MSFKYPDDVMTVFRANGRSASVVFEGREPNLRPLRDAQGRVRVSYLRPDGTEEPDHNAIEFGWAKPTGVRRIGRLPENDPLAPFSEWDRESSASRQHFIDTGRFLTYAEVAEYATVTA